MKLIVGLGNPGLKYKFTRHNIGARVVEQIAKENKINFKTDLSIQAKVAQGRIRGQEISLLKPLRFMNLCGLSIVPFMLKRNIAINDSLVIADCLDLDLSKLKFRQKGSDAGHRGMRSIINSLGRNDFSRIKIGIGRPARHNVDVSEYVLSKFTSSEEKLLKPIIDQAKQIVYDWLK
jgi:PTH1 family peptidyl-tRNA hydrolase